MKSKLGIISLLDPKGSGKTMMIKLSNGLLQSNDGKVLINGLQPSPEAKKMYFIYQIRLT
ncbi:ATP-binding cassette domain-containing protein [Streptococcus intermedius]|uniref:ATP-binding cassette domain-containing protein n=1 Tax=Streptococcus intermedius TaxID=1338 RepID=UPI003CE46F9B